MTKASELQGLLDSKKEYVEHLCDMLAEPMVACFQRVYKGAMERPDARNKSILVVFQEELGKVTAWNQVTISEEFAAARKKSGCKYVADLVKAVLVTYVKISIISNTANADTSRVKLRVPTAENFYHKCIVLFAREIWKQPYLFYHKVANIEAQHNLTEVENIARKVVKAAVRSFLPMDQLIRDINLGGSGGDHESVDDVASAEEESEETEQGSEEEDDEEERVSDDETSEYEEVTEPVHVEEEPETTVVEEDDAEQSSEKEIDIVDENHAICYDDKELKDVEIVSHVSHEDYDDDAAEPHEPEDAEAPKKRIIFGSMLINKGRNKLIKPKKKAVPDAFF
jgi:hypothetical protein